MKNIYADIQVEATHSIYADIKVAIASATVKSFLMSLQGKLMKYDQRLTRRDGNIYRMSHFMGALDNIEKDVAAFLNDDGPEAMKALRRSMSRRFDPQMPPVRKVLQEIDAWETSGSFPKYGSEDQETTASFRAEPLDDEDSP